MKLEFYGLILEKILKYLITRKSVQWAPSCAMRTDGRTDRQTDRQTDRYDEANNRFSQVCERSQNGQ